MDFKVLSVAHSHLGTNEKKDREKTKWSPGSVGSGGPALPDDVRRKNEEELSNWILTCCHPARTKGGTEKRQSGLSVLSALVALLCQTVSGKMKDTKKKNLVSDWILTSRQSRRAISARARGRTEKKQSGLPVLSVLLVNVT